MDLLITEIISMFEDRQPSHQPGRERRLAGPVGINVAEGVLEKRPIDHLREIHQRMLEVDDLIKSGTEQVGLPAVFQFPRSHRITPRKNDPAETESRFEAGGNRFRICKKSKVDAVNSGKFKAA
jgi:hypothetical protein